MKPKLFYLANKTSAALLLAFALVVSLPFIAAAAHPNESQARAFLQAGDAKQNAGDFAAAIENYSKAIGVDPKSAVAFSNRADAEKKKGTLRAALTDYNRALALDPKCASARTGLADLKANKLYRTKDVPKSGFTAELNFPRLSPSPTPYIPNFTQGDVSNPKSLFDLRYELARKAPDYYYWEARRKLAENDLAGAIAVYDEEIKSGPMADTFSRRGFVKAELGDRAGAKTDADLAIELDATNPFAYIRRGFTRVVGGDPAGALADYNRAVELDPKLADAYYHRANAEYAAHDWAKALADYCLCCEVAKAPEDYAHLFIWLARMRLGESQAAGDELAAFVAQRAEAADAAWVRQIAGYFLGKITEAELLSAAASPEAGKDRGQHCEAWFYIGEKNLLNGAKADAAEDFRQCLATGQRTFTEYQLAGIEVGAAAH